MLAAAGTFAVFSYAVSRRTPEIGLRLALGAQRRQVLGLVLAGSLRLTVVGVLLGLAAAWPVAHWLGSLLFGVEPTDPVTVGLVVTLVIGSAIVACLGPARRALNVDPTVALRAE
jgi:ABC-type antimicrobial peptide transport system permease subunit